MRYKTDLPDGYAPRSSARKNSKSSMNTTTGGGAGGGESFPMSTSVSATQINQNLPNLSSTAPGAAPIVPPLGTKQMEKRISSAPPARHQKVNARKVSVSKLFTDVAHLDDELQVSYFIIFLSYYLIIILFNCIIF